MSKIQIDGYDLDVEWRDSGKWRSYELTTHGDTVQQAIDNAAISEVDQDGGEIDTYGFDDASNEVQKAVMNVINKNKIHELLDLISVKEDEYAGDKEYARKPIVVGEQWHFAVSGNSVAPNKDFDYKEQNADATKKIQDIADKVFGNKYKTEITQLGYEDLTIVVQADEPMHKRVAQKYAQAIANELPHSDPEWKKDYHYDVTGDLYEVDSDGAVPGGMVLDSVHADKEKKD